jgi:hypothetical protein
VQSRKHEVWSRAEETGATVVSDGAKLSTRKRAMLNTSLALPDGLEFLQQTDATGRRKDARFLADDQSKALEACGTITQVIASPALGLSLKPAQHPSSPQHPSPNLNPYPPPLVQVEVEVDGAVLTKRKSSIGKIVIFDRGGGCVNALKLIEEEWVLVTDTCKTHLANLLAGDIAMPFKAHIKTVHLVIIFITSHDVPYGIFADMPGVRALLIPAATRFLTEVLCVRSVLEDKLQIQQLAIDKAVISWVDKQELKVKQKFREVKALVLSDDWWHKTEVFVAIEEPVEAALRCLDSGTPNLKDAAFAYQQLSIEYGDPLLGRLAKIKDWGEIDLHLVLGSEHLGTLASFVKAMLRKRKPDWLSPLVIAAAAVNPIYSYSVHKQDLWVVVGADPAVRAIIKKFCWGDPDREVEALSGWNRYRRVEGVYKQEEKMLQRMVQTPLDFFAHVIGASSLNCDTAFGEIATWLVCGFCGQSGAERTNKYMVDVQGRKHESRLNLAKGRVKLEVKMALLHAAAKKKVHATEQRHSACSVAEDVRALYLGRRQEAKEAVVLRERLAELRQAERAAEAEAGEVDEAADTLVTLEDVTDVLGRDPVVIEEEQTEPYMLPAGRLPVTEPPPASQLVGFARNVSAPDVVGKQLFFNYDGYGWLLGKVLRRNGDQRRSMDNGTIANFIVAYDMDEGSSTAMLLESEDYSAQLLAPIGSWFLLSEEEAMDGEAAAGHEACLPWQEGATDGEADGEVAVEEAAVEEAAVEEAAVEAAAVEAAAVEAPVEAAAVEAAAVEAAVGEAAVGEAAGGVEEAAGAEAAGAEAAGEEVGDTAATVMDVE